MALLDVGEGIYGVQGSHLLKGVNLSDIIPGLKFLQKQNNFLGLLVAFNCILDQQRELRNFLWTMTFRHDWHWCFRELRMGTDTQCQLQCKVSLYFVEDKAKNLSSVFEEKRKRKQEDLGSSQSREQSLLAELRGKHGPGDISGCSHILNTCIMKTGGSIIRHQEWEYSQECGHLVFLKGCPRSERRRDRNIWRASLPTRFVDCGEDSALGPDHIPGAWGSPEGLHCLCDYVFLWFYGSQHPPREMSLQHVAALDFRTLAPHTREGKQKPPWALEQREYNTGSWP
ncbi:hypothetical protein E5288_WYG012402 [Bos mutus]|uniref:Uncharacterized protein n=1 Tax=Bos mutus TaxID=72004 RepID=A0A6B0RSS3_9CETA|nr:hypothetical protein [Bos mutus]